MWPKYNYYVTRGEQRGISEGTISLHTIDDSECVHNISYNVGGVSLLQEKIAKVSNRKKKTTMMITTTAGSLCHRGD